MNENKTYLMSLKKLYIIIYRGSMNNYCKYAKWKLKNKIMDLFNKSYCKSS